MITFLPLVTSKLSSLTKTSPLGATTGTFSNLIFSSLINLPLSGSSNTFAMFYIFLTTSFCSLTFGLTNVPAFTYSRVSFNSVIKEVTPAKC